MGGSTGAWFKLRTLCYNNSMLKAAFDQKRKRDAELHEAEEFGEFDREFGTEFGDEDEGEGEGEAAAAGFVAFEAVCAARERAR